MYDVKSLKAEEFISDEEIMATLAYADENKNNVEVIDAILVKAREQKGLTHREASVLLACDMPEKIQEMYDLAKKIKELVDDKAQFADWSTRDDIKNQLNMELTVLLYQNGYPPEWDEEVFEKVMEQAENFKKYSDK